MITGYSLWTDINGLYTVPDAYYYDASTDTSWYVSSGIIGTAYVNPCYVAPTPPPPTPPPPTPDPCFLYGTEIKMADLPSRSVKGTSYGAQYHDPEGDDDADNKKPKASKPTDATKRGRGRPSGSKSGAKQQGSEKSSNYGGIDRTTYALHLPNNNK